VTTPSHLCALHATKIGEQRLTDKIYVDATQPATLNDGAGVLTDCPTLGEAITAWQRLLSEQKIRATIKVIGGPVGSTGYIRAQSRSDDPGRSETRPTNRMSRVASGDDHKKKP